MAGEPLGEILFGKTRRAILLLLYGHPDEEYYLRQIARMTGVGMGGLQREIAALRNAGIIVGTPRGRQVFYRANPDCSIYRELKNLLTKTAGAVDVLRKALTPLSDRIEFAFVFGSVARGQERVGSDLDILVAGSVSFAEVSKALRGAQETLGREINPSVYSSGELRRKAAEGHHFLATVLAAEKIFVIGTEHDLKRVASKPLAR